MWIVEGKKVMHTELSVNDHLGGREGDGRITLIETEITEIFCEDVRWNTTWCAC
jgi:hypothetical protein